MSAFTARPAPRRAGSGRFVSAAAAADLAGLPQLVRDIAEAVVEEYAVQVARGLAPAVPLLPTSITREQWNAMRDTWPGSPPTAKEVQRRLARAWRRPAPWKEVLEVAFGLRGQPELVHVRAAQAERDKAIGPEHVEFAMLLARRELGRDELVAREYVDTRELLVARDNEEARSYRGNLEAILPTVSQIETVFGTLGNALDHYGLGRADPVYYDGKKGVPVAESITRFYKATGQLPAWNWLQEFAADKGFALVRDRVLSWPEELEAGCAYVAELGWPEPPAYDDRAPKPEWDATPWVEEGDREYRPRTYWTDERIYKALGEFLEVVGERYASGRRYEQTRMAGRYDWPSHSTVQNVLGSFARGVAHTRTGARAAGALDGVELPEDLMHAARRRRQRQVAAPQAKEVLGVLERAEGPLLSAEIEHELGWPRSTVRNWLTPLWKDGQVDRHGGGRKNARWSIAGRFPAYGVSPGRELPEDRREWPQARQLEALVSQHGPLSASRIGALTGWSPSTVRTWARLLCGDNGPLVCEGDGKRRYYRLASQPPRAPEGEPQAQALLELLRERGTPLAPKEIMEALGWQSHKTVKRWAEVLIAAKLARRAGSTADRLYELVEPGSEPGPAELKPSDTPQGRELIALLATHGRQSPAQLLEHARWRQHKSLQSWLDRLAAEGVVAVDGIGKKRVWRLASQAAPGPEDEPLAQAILALLRERGEPLAPGQIIATLQLKSYKAVKRHTAALVAAGLVGVNGQKASRRYWALTGVGSGGQP